MAGFVQVIEFDTSHIEEVKMLGEKFRAERSAAGGSVSIRGVLAADRDRPNHYVQVVEFSSYEEAMDNSKRAETSELAARMTELCDSPPTYQNLDVIQVISV